MLRRGCDQVITSYTTDCFFLHEHRVWVTVLDANHCLGSVMFLFEGASIPGGAVLCTGDFRADNRLISRFDSDPSFAKLADTYISKIYLDNTHLDHSNQSFPDRMDAEKMLELLFFSDDLLFLFASF
ncbi:hypothetical protein TELCIR_18030 [Teladorsagia circumcincta]|uniref:DNA repair metallo-beta-lactamase domain-containing protein n=1 Tax=Teladorsagia circumcincta TaxID=45464 RepID=A0A2G9TSM6_TELCI|nr:hypothetical protein TELCIR_18030 [Teladorsagia circumcincta]